MSKAGDPDPWSSQLGGKLLGALRDALTDHHIDEVLYSQIGEAPNQAELIRLVGYCADNQATLRLYNRAAAIRFCVRAIEVLGQSKCDSWPGIQSCLRVLEGVVFMCSLDPVDRPWICFVVQSLLKGRFLPRQAAARLDSAIMSLSEPAVRTFYASAELPKQPDDLETELQNIVASLRPTLDNEQQRDDVFHIFEEVVFKCFGVHGLQFGSAVNGFQMQSSDIDIMVLLDTELQAKLISQCRQQHADELAKHEEERQLLDWSFLSSKSQIKIASIAAVRALALELKNAGLHVTEVIETARVPIVKCKHVMKLHASGGEDEDESHEFEVDISFCNHIAYFNSRLLRAYADFDSRAVALGLLVKLWAKRRKINSALEGTLSSYSYTLMVIHYLQRRGLLPNLQLLSAEKRENLLISSCEQILDGGHNVWFADPALYRDHLLGDQGDRGEDESDQEFLQRWWLDHEPIKAPVSELLYGFFRYFALEFNAYADVVSIRFEDGRMSKLNYFSVSEEDQDSEVGDEDEPEVFEDAVYNGCGPNDDGATGEDHVQGRFTGRLVSYDDEVGWGKLSCDEALSEYGVDVMLNHEEFERSRASIGDLVTFSVVQGAKGQALACNLQLAQLETQAESSGADAATSEVASSAETAAPAPAAVPGEPSALAPLPDLLVGTVRSFTQESGYGFIACEATYGHYKRDVFLHQNQAVGIVVGDRVSFQVELSSKGQPQARQVVKVSTAEPMIVEECAPEAAQEDATANPSELRASGSSTNAPLVFDAASSSSAIPLVASVRDAEAILEAVAADVAESKTNELQVASNDLPEVKRRTDGATPELAAKLDKISERIRDTPGATFEAAESSADKVSDIGCDIDDSTAANMASAESPLGEVTGEGEDSAAPASAATNKSVADTATPDPAAADVAMASGPTDPASTETLAGDVVEVDPCVDASVPTDAAEDAEASLETQEAPTTQPTVETPPGCVALGTGVGKGTAPVLSMEQLRVAAEERSAAAASARADSSGQKEAHEVLMSNIGPASSSPSTSIPSSIPLPTVAINALFMCHVDASGTAVQVLLQASLTLVASVSSGGAKVVDFALQAEDSHLLTAFDDGRVIIYRLTPERVAPRVLLKFDELHACSVLWHPTNPRVFLTLHQHRGLLWHLQQIVQFSTLKPTGCEQLEGEGVQTALRVTEEFVENAACEALPRLHLPSGGAGQTAGVGDALEEKPEGTMAHAAITPDGHYMVASSSSLLLLWRLGAKEQKDEQSAPRPVCVQMRPLPKGVTICHLRLVPRYASDKSIYYLLGVFAETEVLLYMLDPRPSGGKGFWLPSGRLMCPVQQRLRFPCTISADIFFQEAELSGCTTLVVALLGAEEERRGDNTAGNDGNTPMILAGVVEDSEDLHTSQERAIVPKLSVFPVPQPAARSAGTLTAIRALERSARAARVFPEGAEAHSWAVAGFLVTPTPGSLSSRCVCLALPKPGSTTADPVPSAPLSPEEFPPGLTPPASYADKGAEGHEPAMAVDTAPSAPATIAVAEAEKPPVMESIAKAGIHSDSDPVTPSMVRNLSTFLEKRAKTSSDNIFQSFKEQLPATIAASSQGRRGARQPCTPDGELPIGGGAASTHGKRKGKEETVQNMLKSLEKDCNHMIDQAARNEKFASQSLRRMSDPEALKQTAGYKALKDNVEKELVKWRDGVLYKAVLKAVEGKVFSDKFVEGLQSAPHETAPLLEALQPARAQLLEAAHGDLKQWCGSLVAKQCKSILKDQSIMPRARGAIDGAMTEVATQGGQALESFMEDTKASVNTSSFTKACQEAVVNSVRQEAKLWEESSPPFADAARRGPHAAAASSLTSAADSRALRDLFSRRMRAAALPLQRDLDAAARDLELAGSMLSNCRATADAVQAASSAVAAGAPGQGPDTARSSSASTGFTATCRVVLTAIATGRLHEGLHRALAWDARNQQAQLSLAEVACDCLLGVRAPGLPEVAGAVADEAELDGERAEPEEVLARPEVASVLDGKLTMLLMHTLLQRSVFESVDAQRIEVNLEWVLGLLHIADSDPSFASVLQAARGKMTAACETLVQGVNPPALAKADAATKRHVAMMARLALKGLGMLHVPAAPRS